MTLGELIAALDKEDPNKPVAFGFGTPHSYRGKPANPQKDPEPAGPNLGGKEHA